MSDSAGFKTWGESNSEARNVLLPDFGMRTLNDTKSKDRKVMWQHLAPNFFFDKDPVIQQFGGRSYIFSGSQPEKDAKERRVVNAIVALTVRYKANNYAPNFLNETDGVTACKDFYDIFILQGGHVVMELLSLYAKSIIDEYRTRLEKASSESDDDFKLRQERSQWDAFDDFSAHLNDVFSHFGINQILTRQGFVPRIDQKIIEAVYIPVLSSLSHPIWTEVNNYLSESFAEYQKNTPEGYSTCVTKAVTALQAFLQILVYGKTGKGDLSILIVEAQKRKLIPDDAFSKTMLRGIESVLMQERQATGDPHPRKEFANESNSRLVLNLVMVFLQHCISN